MKTIVLFSTAPTKNEAQKIARALVSKRLVAGVNIVPNVRSIYRWKGKICDGQEALMIMKSIKPRLSAIKREVKRLHSYECPELVAMPIADGLTDYIKWIRKSCSKACHERA